MAALIYFYRATDTDSGAGGPARPNVILVVIDTLRADFLNCMGGRNPATPSIDTLASMGVKFDRCISAAPITGPSITSIFTGQYPTVHGVRFNLHEVPEVTATIAARLGEAGYETAGFVSSTIISSRYGFNRGFDLYDDRTTDEYSPNHYERGAEKTNARAIEWLRNRPADKPFFLFVHYFDPHAPYRAHFGKQAGKSFPADYLDGLYRDQDVEAIKKVYDEIVEYYRQEVTYTDMQLGRLLRIVEETGLLEDTVIVLTADHGEELFDHDYYCQHGRSLYDTVLNVPLIIHLPGRAHAGGSVDSTVRTVDILPTVMEAAGVDPGGGLSGTSLMPLVDSAEADDRTALSFRAPHDFFWEGLGIAATRGRWKLIQFEKTGDRFFDIETDPRELENLAGKGIGEEKMLGDEIADHASRHPGNVRKRYLSEPEEKMLKDLGYIQ